MSVPDVRLLIPDLGTGDEQIFTDDQISTFLTLNDDNVRLAAAEALEVAATDEIMTFKITRTDDQSVNGVTGAEALLLRARRMREQADGLTDSFEVVYPFRRGSYILPEATARPVWH